MMNRAVEPPVLVMVCHIQLLANINTLISIFYTDYNMGRAP